MPKITSNRRNIGISAHIDAGKTTFTERTLFYTGTTHKMGNVHDGATTTDWMAAERERGITIVSATVTFFWQGFQIQLIDTPGHIDFTLEVERATRVLDGQVLLLDAARGVQAQTFTVWKQAKRYNVPILIVVNKMDCVGANFDSSIKSVIEKLGARPLILCIPVGIEDSFSGIIDLIEMKYLKWSGKAGENYSINNIPENMEKKAIEEREKLIASLGEEDENIFNSFINNEPINKEEIKNAIRKTTIEGKFVPAICISAYKNKGIEYVLDSIVNYLPSPEDRPMQKPLSGVITSCTENDQFLGFIFKIMVDPTGGGKLYFCRIYSGQLKSETILFVPRTNESFKAGNFVRMFANKKQPLQTASSGDIVALVGNKDLITGDTVCDPRNPIVLENMHYPDKLVTVAIIPLKKEQQDKLVKILSTFKQEDPSFDFMGSQDGSILLMGVGSLHLEIKIKQLEDEFGILVKTEKPQVSYKAAIDGTTTVTYEHKKQSGGAGQYGKVTIEFSPLTECTTDQQFQIDNSKKKNPDWFLDEIVGGVIPYGFIPSVQKGVENALSTGYAKNIPIINAKVRLIDGAHHCVDSNQISFELAGYYATKTALEKIPIKLLEPIAKTEVTVPSEFLGTIISDINSRRGKIDSIEDCSEQTKIIYGSLPMSEIFDYISIIRENTKGSGELNYDFSHYAIVSDLIKDKILKTIV